MFFERVENKLFGKLVNASLMSFVIPSVEVAAVRGMGTPICALQVRSKRFFHHENSKAYYAKLASQFLNTYHFE